MFGLIAIGIGAGIVGLLGVASRKPDTFEVRRSISIRAGAQQIYNLLEDFRRWRLWSPWEDIDPDLQRSYAGPTSGEGASYEWEGKKAGAGRMEIARSAPPNRLDIKLDFTKPIKASNRIEFILEEAGGSTAVNWVMKGSNGMANKVMSVFVSLDKLVGKDFEKGLARLKAAAEEPGAPPTVLPPEV